MPDPFLHHFHHEVTVTIFLCGVSCLTSNARMLYAFARDDAVPGSKIWVRAPPEKGLALGACCRCELPPYRSTSSQHVVNERFGIPTNAVLGMALAAALIALPIVYSTTACASATSRLRSFVLNLSCDALSSSHRRGGDVHHDHRPVHILRRAHVFPHL